MSADHNQYQKDQFPDSTKMMRKWINLSRGEMLRIIDRHEFRDYSDPQDKAIAMIKDAQTELKEKNT